MKKVFLLFIPIVAGILVGSFMALYNEPKNDSKLFLESRLTQNGSPVLGDPLSAVTILEWGDYQCTFCYKFHQGTFDVLKRDYIETGKVKFVFKDFPLNGPDSILAAESSYCADDQGKYWQYHDELYKNWGGENTGWVTRNTLNFFAINVGLDLETFNNCLDEHKYTQKVNQLYDFGKELGVDATPTFLVFNNEKIIKIRGNQPLEVFLKSIENVS